MEATVERCCRRNKTITGHPQLEHFKGVTSGGPLTQIQGCLRACSAVILLAGLMVSIWLIKFFASGVTVSHSGDGN